MQLREKLPDQYDTIRLFAEVLPGKEASPAFPFSGFTVNINVVTRAHRDVKDETLCVVLVVGSFDGGELVLWEQGLVLELQTVMQLHFHLWKSLISTSTSKAKGLH